MNFDALFAKTGNKVVRCGLVGIGDFGASLLAQAEHVPNLKIALICDRDPARMAAAVAATGADTTEIVMVQDMDDADGVQLDVLVEATGNPATAAAVGEQAIDRGQHLVMVSKEAAIVAGPILHARASAKGLVYTEVEGDQPSLLIGLMSWARTIGLDIRAAGKSSEYDFVLGPDDSLTWRNQHHPNSGLTALWERNAMSWQELTDAREARAANLGLPTRTVPDFCEMGVVVNASGFTPDRPEFHTPILRPTELAEAFKRSADGGLLAGDRRIDVFNCLRRTDEASFAGGVFILVNGHDDKTWGLLRDKGHIVANDAGVAVLYNPQHLLGIEAPITILAAGLLGIPTGATNPKPVVDLVARTDRDFAAGERLAITDAHHHEVAGLKPELIPAVRFATANPCPYYLATGAQLRQDVPADTLITAGMLEVNKETVLARLRREQDQHFGVQ